MNQIAGAKTPRPPQPQEPPSDSQQAAPAEPENQQDMDALVRAAGVSAYYPQE